MLLREFFISRLVLTEPPMMIYTRDLFLLFNCHPVCPAGALTATGLLLSEKKNLLSPSVASPSPQSPPLMSKLDQHPQQVRGAWRDDGSLLSDRDEPWHQQQSTSYNCNISGFMLYPLAFTTFIIYKSSRQPIMTTFKI